MYVLSLVIISKPILQLVNNSWFKTFSIDLGLGRNHKMAYLQVVYENLKEVPMYKSIGIESGFVENPIRQIKKIIL